MPQRHCSITRQQRVKQNRFSTQFLDYIISCQIALLKIHGILECMCSCSGLRVSRIILDQKASLITITIPAVKFKLFQAAASLNFIECLLFLLQLHFKIGQIFGILPLLVYCSYVFFQIFLQHDLRIMRWNCLKLCSHFLPALFLVINVIFGHFMSLHYKDESRIHKIIRAEK
jgi:hypothetical protein